MESRRSFIESCIATLEAYPFLTGIDLDWEYPGSARAGGQGDEGNPVRGDDRTNYTALLRELRKALDGHFGDQGRLLTVCAGAPTGILSLQDYEALHPYVDRINLMTYDFTGSYNNYTGHHSPLYGTLSADTAVRYLLSKGVPAEKINIGSPLYSHSWKLYRTNKNPVGAAAKGLYSDLDYGVLRALEKAAVSEGIPGWHMGYDEKAEAAYLWNDDAKDGSCLTFHTYESSRSLGAKLNYIRENALGGLIVWQVNGDSWQEGYPMITQMYRALHGEEQ